nr:hypothetical protein [uncultured Prevotella sp.]
MSAYILYEVLRHRRKQLKIHRHRLLVHPHSQHLPDIPSNNTNVISNPITIRIQMPRIKYFAI